MKSWRGDYVIVFPHKRWHFHKCVVCGRDVAFGTQASKTGRPRLCGQARLADRAGEARGLEQDRQRYRREVLKPRFRIE